MKSSLIFYFNFFKCGSVQHRIANASAWAEWTSLQETNLLNKYLSSKKEKLVCCKMFLYEIHLNMNTSICRHTLHPSMRNCFYSSFCCLNFIKQTIYSLILPAPWWASLLMHLVSCSWARIPKKFLEEINFTCPAV